MVAQLDRCQRSQVEHGALTQPTSAKTSLDVVQQRAHLLPTDLGKPWDQERHPLVLPVQVGLGVFFGPRVAEREAPGKRYHRALRLPREHRRTDQVAANGVAERRITSAVRQTRRALEQIDALRAVRSRVRGLFL